VNDPSIETRLGYLTANHLRRACRMDPAPPLLFLSSDGISESGETHPDIADSNDFWLMAARIMHFTHQSGRDQNDN
jgi:hypothetical protein